MHIIPYARAVMGFVIAPVYYQLLFASGNYLHYFCQKVRFVGRRYLAVKIRAACVKVPEHHGVKILVLAIKFYDFFSYKFGIAVRVSRPRGRALGYGLALLAVNRGS